MKVFYNNSDSSYKVILNLETDNYLEANLLINTKEGYKSIGLSGIYLEGHSSFGLLYNPKNKYKFRDKNNVVQESYIKLLPINRITYGSRMKYDEVENRYSGSTILQIDTNTLSNDIKEMQMLLLKVQKRNVIFNGFETGDIEFVSMDMQEVFKSGSKRHYFWDNYCLVFNDIEYKFKETRDNTKKINGIINTNEAEYVEFYVKKYATDFSTPLQRECDNERIFIEVSAGISNVKMLELINGQGKFRWYPLGYKGTLKIKLGWRWYAALNEIELLVQ